MNGEICVYLYPLYHLSFSRNSLCVQRRESCVFVRFAYIKNISVIAYGERRIPRWNGMKKYDMEECSAYWDAKESSGKRVGMRTLKTNCFSVLFPSTLTFIGFIHIIQHPISNSLDFVLFCFPNGYKAILPDMFMMRLRDKRVKTDDKREVYGAQNNVLS